jgi:hypothetical protein
LLDLIDGRSNCDGVKFEHSSNETPDSGTLLGRFKNQNKKKERKKKKKEKKKKRKKDRSPQSPIKTKTLKQVLHSLRGSGHQCCLTAARDEKKSHNKASGVDRFSLSQSTTTTITTTTITKKKKKKKKRVGR